MYVDVIINLNFIYLRIETIVIKNSVKILINKFVKVLLNIPSEYTVSMARNIFT